MLDLVTNLQILRFSEAKKEIINEWNDKFGITCLSEKPDIIQMWAHYCNNHEGIVIGLDEAEIVRGREDALVKVDYSKAGMVLWPVRLVVDKEHGVRLQDMMHRKEESWRYEKEVRMYFSLDEKDDDGNYYYKIEPISIKEIYLGLRSKEETRIIAESIILRKGYKHVKLFVMEKDDSAFRLLAKDITPIVV